MFLNCFNVLLLKIIFKNKKNIILILFQVKNILKNNYYHIHKYPRDRNSLSYNHNNNLKKKKSKRENANVQGM
jgi:hypothetical protein